MIVKSIVIKGNNVSEEGFSRLVESNKRVGNDFQIIRFDAIIPEQTDEIMEDYKLDWSWVWSGSKFDENTKIKMQAYGGKNPKRRIACFLSHFLIWEHVATMGEPTLILEHDAEFIRKFEPNGAINSPFGAIGINDPRGATRRANVFHDIVQNAKEDFLPCPTIDKMEIAQGLAGASAYLIKQSAAQKVIKACYDFGCWPNDAILCQQLLPKELGVTKKYYTKVQGLLSTTTSLE